MDWFLALGVGVIALMVVAVHGMIARENAMRDEHDARVRWTVEQMSRPACSEYGEDEWIVVWQNRYGGEEKSDAK